MYDWSGPAQITDQVCDWSGPAQITDQTVMQGCAYLDLCINTSICLHNYMYIYIYIYTYIFARPSALGVVRSQTSILYLLIL